LKIVSVEEMQCLEEFATASGLSTDQLIDRAGNSIAKEIRAILGRVADRRLLFLVGPGNNGSDGLVSASTLSKWGAKVTAYLLTKRRTNDEKANLAKKEQVTVIPVELDPGLKNLALEIKRSDLIVDAVLGTGQNRPLQGVIKKTMGMLEDREGLLVSLDIPTGTNADTGIRVSCSPKPDIILALGNPKIGMFNIPHMANFGKLKVLDIGIPSIADRFINTQLLDDSWIKDRLPVRSVDSHKGTFGHALIIAGSKNYPGAASLAAKAAMRSGPGLVTLAFPRTIQSLLTKKLTEAIQFPLDINGSGELGSESAEPLRSVLDRYSSLAVGPGMGFSIPISQFIEELFFKGKHDGRTLVIDADGLNNLNYIDNWYNKTRFSLILTPHTREMARLTNLSVDEIKCNRIEIARTQSALWKAIVVLKGPYTIVATPRGKVFINPFANPILSTGGTGDVLTGIISGLIAQGLSGENASCCGVYLHGLAGEKISERLGDRGLIATDIVETIPATIKTLINK
jgi:hydroxyethylthiazole kinase-like uncharacterized protein yjeF